MIVSFVIGIKNESFITWGFGGSDGLEVFEERLDLRGGRTGAEDFVDCVRGGVGRGLLDCVEFQ